MANHDDDGNDRDDREDKKEKKETIAGLVPKSSKARFAVANINPTSERIWKWLCDLIDEGWPEKIRVAAAYGSGGMKQGPVIKDFNFPTRGKKQDVEDMIELANAILQLCDEDVDALQKPTTYSASAYNLAVSDRAYSRVAFALRPSGVLPAHVEERGGGEEQDSGTIRDDLLRELYKDRRFQQMHQLERDERHDRAMDGIMARYEMRLQQTEATNRELLNTHLRLIELKEQLADKKATRELAERKQLFWQQKIEDAVAFGTTFLPGLIAAATNGKAGIIEAVIAFAKTLDNEQELKLFGNWKDGQRLAGDSILDEDQAILFSAIVAGRAPVEAVDQFMTGLRMDQQFAVRALLRPEQIAMIGQLAQTLQAMKQKNGASNGSNGAAS